MKPNADQQAAIDAIDGVYVAIAGPGSGKTTVLIARHLNMITRGIDQKDVLNLTFTAAAAETMAKRSGVLEAENYFRTFHSFALDLLKKERTNLPFETTETILPVEMQEFKLLFDLAKTYPVVKDWRALQEKIADWKKMSVRPERAMQETASSPAEFPYARAYQDYENVCRKQGWLDFDSIMLEAVNLLKNPAIRARHQRKYLAVDECQDTDVVQFQMLQLLFAGNIFAVGDENQLIYEWRSAQPGNLTHFSNKFPNAKTLYLGQNYRSTKVLVDFFREILPVDNGLATKMISENEQGTPPTFMRYTDAEQEAQAVMSKITEPEHTAIIARTNRQLFVYQRLCAMRGVKYKFLGKKDFWHQNEVKSLLRYAKSVRQSAQPANEVLADLIRRHRLVEIYRHAGRPMETSPVENLNAIVQMATGKGTVPEFLGYLERLTRARQSAKGLTLATVHQAKGREWDDVYVIGAGQGIMPHKDGETPEERRIFFVACSRAAKKLEVSFYGEKSEFYEKRWNQIQIYTAETQLGEWRSAVSVPVR